MRADRGGSGPRLGEQQNPGGAKPNLLILWRRGYINSKIAQKNIRFSGLLAERTPLGVSIIDATVIALGIDRIRPHQQPPPIYILPDHQSKHFLWYVFELGA